MTKFPWEPDPLTVRNPTTGLWPGQEHPLDIPDFIRTFRATTIWTPSPAASPPAPAPNWVPPWAATSPPRDA